jgi:murein DD-endopeptidase MepM/ murein hydrolase activator NlpD
MKLNSLDNITTGSIIKNASDNQAYLLQLEQSIAHMHDESKIALANLSNSANKSTSVILYELKQVGIIPRLPKFDEFATGGPLLPANDETGKKSLINEANQVVLSLDRFIAAKKAISLSPVYSPLKKGYRVSSNYGNRKDPILGTRAFHSGTDMAAPRGTSVYSAGDGIVTFVGRNGGYGKVVEIRHDGGLMTKYAHLNSYSVVKGQRIKSGSIIAKVGSTGRSTGPHLHFEVKNSKGTLNSSSFIRVGNKLAQFM